MYQRIAVAALAALAVSGCYLRKTATAVNPAQYILQPVVNSSFVVDARGFKPFKVVVAAGEANPRLEGSFSASGANNDIEMLLLEENQFLNWQNKLSFKAAYESGRVTADRIRFDLPSYPATYYVVFSNRFSLLSKKSIVADLSLRCERTKKAAAY